MATGIVISVTEKLFSVLQSQELKEICSVLGYESQLDELSLTVSTIKAVLLDVESKSRELTHGGREFIERLKDAVYDVDDVLDDFNTMVQKEKNKSGGKISKKVRRFFSRSNQFLVAFNMSQEIKKLRNKLDNIAKDRQQFGFSDVYVPIRKREETMSYAGEHCIIGREADKEAIVGMLLTDTEPHDQVSFVTVVGIGGLGKTALAQLVYNDERIASAFELKLWVCVSEDFSVEQIFGKMLGKDEYGVENLQREVRKMIQGKRYLIVLDDVWSESRNDWVKLRAFLEVGGRGSRIVVTSRSKKVANVIDSNRLYELQGLSPENSWKLFKKIAFKQGKEPVDRDLIDIGKDIVKKCAHVPLSLRVIGGMLYEQDKSRWLSFRNIDLMKMGQGEDGIMPVLKFSYYHLTPALKSCFSYCALFPKDHRIEKKLLINLWMAQGCLDPPHDGRSIEDIGEDYFSILLHRCFFQDMETNKYSQNSTCKMHDLMHDLALEVAGKESLMLDAAAAAAGKFDKNVRHLLITTGGHYLLVRPDSSLAEMKSLRTLLLAYSPLFLQLSETNLATIFSNFRCLRVLDLQRLFLYSLPSSVGNLSHLRHLDLSYNRSLRYLPKSFTKLHNLLVLDVSSSGLRELPEDFRKLINLRHLDISDCYDLTHMPTGMDILMCLHTLTMFVVGGTTSKKVGMGRLKDLKALVNLSGVLEIKFQDGFQCDPKEGGPYLFKKEHLTALKISWKEDSESECNDGVSHEISLDGLQPHGNLKELEIRNYRGSKLPSWAVSLASIVPCLVKISLFDFSCLSAFPSLSQLNHLKVLELGNMPNVEFLETDTTAAPCALASRGTDDHSPFFPSLEELRLWNFPKLKGWRSNTVLGGEDLVASFPHLHFLTLSNCPSMITFPRCPHLKNVGLYGINKLLRFNSNSLGDSGLYLEHLGTDNLSVLNMVFGDTLCGIRELRIQRFELDSLATAVEGYQVYTSVEELQIEYCNNLTSLSGVGIESLTSLRKLKISNCDNLELEENDDGLPWKNLHSLSHLELGSLPKVLNLPRCLQYLTSLESLDLSFCVFEALPESLQCLTSLRSLKILFCSPLKALPEAISHLPSLKELVVCYCPGLTQRCREPNGEDWPKICHIPNIRIEDMSDHLPPGHQA